MDFRNKDLVAADEKALLYAVAAGDENAFTLLIARYRRRVFTHCITFTRRYEDAEELTQDIFIKLWTDRAALEKVDSFTGYLFIVSRNYLVSYLRKRVK